MDAAAEELVRLTNEGGLVDLSAGVKLRLTGPDAERYLNGQVTQDVRRIAEGTARAACVCTHKGKLEALVQIARTDGGFLIWADESLRDFLPLRMEKYLIADDAVLEDVTEDYDAVHVLGRAPAPEGQRFAAQRLGQDGVDVWLPRGASKGLVFSSAAAVEVLRIARGIPAWKPELSGDILPPEARMEEACIDYFKGCYTGQEVISRLRSVGRVNRLLHCISAARSVRLEAGWTIYSGETGAGSVTSAAWHPLKQAGIALGYLKRSAAGPFTAGPERVAVEVREPGVEC